MRPRYESPEDLAKEAEVLNRFMQHLFIHSGFRHHYHWKKLPEVRYVLDAALMLDRFVRGWVEVKCRKGSPEQYDHWYLSHHKVMKGLLLRDYTGLPFFVLFDWDGKSFVAKLDDPPRTALVWNGRNDRNDAEDEEPVVMIPRSAFKPLLAQPESAIRPLACAGFLQSSAPDPCEPE